MSKHDPATRGGRAPLLIAVAGLLAGLVLVYHGASNLHSIDLLAHPELAHQPGYRLPVLTTVAGILLGIGSPLFGVALFTHRRLGVAEARHRHQAGLIGLAWGVASTVIAGTLESLTAALPGFLGSTEGTLILASFIEEAVKLALPVLLLATAARFREPIVGVWTVLVTGVVFGFVEGIGYVAPALAPALTGRKLLEGPVEGILFLVDVVNRANVELLHPFITVGAAVVIWLAVARGRSLLPAALGAWLVAGLLHAVDDGLISTFVSSWNQFAGLVCIFAYVWAVFFLWFRPRVNRLAAWERAD